MGGEEDPEDVGKLKGRVIALAILLTVLIIGYAIILIRI